MPYGPFQHGWPYSNFHDLNLDWVISLVKQLAAEWAQTQQDWNTQQEAFDSFKKYVNEQLATFQDWFDNLNVQQEINNKLDDMIQDGTLSEIVAGVLDGKYQPIVVDSMSNMTDHSAIYVLSSNGHVYQWGGSSFVDTSMIYNLPRNVYSYVGNLPENTNLRDPSGVNVGCYAVNKNNILGTPDDFEGEYGLYYLLHYASASALSALLFDLHGNMWLYQPHRIIRVAGDCYKYVGNLPENTNLRDPSGVNVGCYAVNKNNILGTPDDFEGEYGLYYLLHYASASALSALLFDLHGNMWLYQPHRIIRVAGDCYKYVGRVANGVNIATSNALQPGCYSFETATISGLPDDYTDEYGYVINYSYTNSTTMLRMLYDRSGKAWICTGSGYKKIDPPFYVGPFPYDDIKTLPDRKYIGKLFSVPPTKTGLPPEYGSSSYGFLYNVYASVGSRFQMLFPAFRSSKFWTISEQSATWNQFGPYKQMYNEKVCFFGDSITAKTFRANVGFVDLIESWANCAVQNLGVSGSGFKAGKPYIDRVSQISDDVTIIAVSCSFNDLNTLPVGTADDTGSSTLGGLMNEFFDSIQEKCPLIKIVGYTTNAWSHARPGNSTAENYVNVFKTICENRCIPFSPVWKDCNLRPWIAQQQETYFTAPNGQTDQTHPNDAGHRILAPIIYDLIHRVVAINM